MTAQHQAALPRLPRIHLIRPQLERRLDEWAPVTIVRGAQGHGKTTLVAHWLANQGAEDVSPIWIDTSRDLTTREQFLTHLIQRISGLDTSDRHTRPTMADVDDALHAAPPGRRIALVVDNVGYLQDRVLAEDLVGLVQRRSGLHLFVCARAAHPIDLIAHGRVDVNVLRPHELLLDKNEIGRLATLMGRQISSATVDTLYDQFGGWMAAVRLALDAPDGEQLAVQQAEAYLVNAVLPGIGDQRGLRHLMRLSLADRLEPGLVAELERDDSTDVLIESGLLDRRHQGDRTTYVIPTAIQRILRKSYLSADPAGARQTHQAIADWLGRQGVQAAARAFRHAVAAGDLGLAQKVAAEYGLSFAISDPDAFVGPLKSLTDTELAAYPMLRIARVTATTAMVDSDADGRMATQRTYFEACARVAADGVENLDIADALYVGAGQVMSLRMRGRLGEAASFGDSLAPIVLGSTADNSSMPGLRALLYLQRALTSTLLAEHELAIRYYQRAWEHGIRSSAGHLPANAAGNLSMTYTLRGEPDRAGLWAARYADSTDADGQCTDYLAGIGFRIGAGIRALDQGDVAGVQAELDALGDGSARVELWPFIAYLNAEYGLHHGDPANALAALDHVVGSRQRALIAPAASAHLLLRARVDLLIAAELGQRARDLLPDRAASIPVLGVPLARIHLMAGEYANARRVVAGLSARSVMTPRDRLALLVIDAAAALRMGDSVAAASLFGRVLTLSEQTRIHRELATISGSDQQQLLSLAAAPADHDVIDLRPVYPDRLHLIELTEREWSLLDALVLTASRQDIADQLYLSLNTVKTQLAGLYRKLGASSREETLMRRNQLGLRR